MDWREAHQRLLQDPDTRKAYESIDLAFEIGKMITDARIAKKMTQAKLAKLVGTKQPSIARLEKGDSLPSLNFLQKIARAFDTQLLPPRLEFMEKSRSVTPPAIYFMLDVPKSLNWDLVVHKDPQRWEVPNKLNALTIKGALYATN